MRTWLNSSTAAKSMILLGQHEMLSSSHGAVCKARCARVSYLHTLFRSLATIFVLAYHHAVPVRHGVSVSLRATRQYSPPRLCVLEKGMHRLVIMEFWLGLH